MATTIMRTMTICSTDDGLFKHIIMSKEGVTVGVRVRPLLPEEGHEEECVRIETGRVAVTGSHRLRQFPFQYLLDRNAPQQQVF